MAEFKGNAVTLTWDGSAIASVRQIDISYNGEPIDITSYDSSGWQELLATSAQDSISISLSGLADTTSAIRADFFNDKSKTIVVTFPSSGDSFTGTFQMTSLSEGAPYNDATSFTMELQSSGTVTFTAGS